MQKQTFSFLLLCYLLMLLSSRTTAQDYAKPQQDTSHVVKPPLVRIKVRDGTVLRGRVLNSNIEYYSISTENLGLIQIPVVNVLSIEQIKESVYSTKPFTDVDFEPLTSTNYTLGDNAFNLKRGEVRYSNTMIVLNKFDVGVTNDISLSCAFVPANGGALLGAKFTADLSPSLHVGLGTYVARGFESSQVATLGEALVTFGKTSSNLTFGAIFATDNKTPFVFQISGMHQISNKVAIATDNFIYGVKSTYYQYNGTYSQAYTKQETDGIITYGAKLLWARTTLDLGMFRLISMGGDALPLGIPYVKVVTRLGKLKQR